MNLKLTAQTRELKEKMAADLIPAVLYGKGVANHNLKVRRIDFEKLFAAAGESSLVDLEIGGQSTKVLVKDLQRDVLKGFFTHIDFYQVNMKEKISTEIPLHFIGESKAVKELGGALIKEISAVEVECLPGDLVNHIDVDISVLSGFADSIRLSDLHLPTGLILTHHTNEVVAAVVEPKVEEEPVVAAPEAAPEAGATPETEAGAKAEGGEAKKDEGKKKEEGKK